MYLVHLFLENIYHCV